MQEEHISRPKSVYGDEENPMEISNNIGTSTHFGCICRQISTAFGSWITSHLNSFARYTLDNKDINYLLTYDRCFEPKITYHAVESPHAR